MNTILWTLCFLVFTGLFCWQVWEKYELLRLARTDDGRDYSRSTFRERLRQTITYAFGQKKFVSGEQPAGVMHIAIFAGFLVLLIQLLTMFIRGWYPEFGFPLISRPYGILKDIIEPTLAGVAVLAIIRRAMGAPKRLTGFLPAEAGVRRKSQWQAYLILIFIIAICITGLFYDAGRFVTLAGEPHIEVERSWQPVSATLAGTLEGDKQLAGIITQASWWTHNLIVLLFLVLLPQSKHFHIITGIPNIFFGKLEPKGKLPRKDYDGEDIIYGRSTLADFTAKQVLDMFSCTECGRCASVCPATRTSKPLAPRQFLLNLRDELYANAKQLRVGEYTEVIVGEGRPVSDDVLWSCVTCRACEEACPINIEYIDKIVDLRQHLVQEKARLPDEIYRTFKGMEENYNPFGLPSSERASWAAGLKVPTLEEKPNPEYLYYVGCGGSFDENHKKTTQRFVRLLNKAGLDFAILGTEETCNGETARRLGNEYLFQTLAKPLIDRINASGVKKIIVNCPHCFNTMKNEYPEFGGNWEIIRAAELVELLIEQDQVPMKKEVNKRIAYHDSCYYGRHNDIYDEQRNVLNKIPGVELREIETCKSAGTCCGGGGGGVWMQEDPDKRVSMLRTNEALKEEPDIIATSCPFCKIMMGSGVEEVGVADKVQVLDLIDLVSEQIE